MLATGADEGELRVGNFSWPRRDLRLTSRVHRYLCGSIQGELLIAIKDWVSSSLKLNFADFLGPEVERHGELFA